MPKLYYALEVWDQKMLGRGKRFRLESNFPFLSPIGTEMYITDGSDEPSFWVNVVAHKHVMGTQWSTEKGDYYTELSHFYMVLGVDENNELFSSDSDTDPSSLEPEAIWQMLIDIGWEEGYNPSK